MEKPTVVNVKAEELITALRAGQSGVIDALYDQHRAAFLSWAGKRFYSTPGDIEDAWQESVAIFYQKVQSKQLIQLTCSVKTFLFAVGYKWLQKNGRKLKRIWWNGEVDEVLSNNQQLNTITFEDDLWEEERLILLSAMEELSPQCREVLTARHYHERTIEELMETYQYISKNAVSATLSGCLSKLKRLIQEKIIK